MIRLADFLLALGSILLMLPVIIIVYILGLFDTGSPIFKQERMGKNQKPFFLYKFRSMHKNTKSVATHLATKSQITPFGKFLRASKLDELPQLFNVLNGDMSLVGPRPNLFNQEELIAERRKRNVYSRKPGITGLAQLNRIDMSTPVQLAEKDAEMIADLDFQKYMSYALRTMIGGGSGDRVKKE